MPTIWAIVALLIVAMVLWALRSRPTSHGAHPASIVVLLSEPRSLEVHFLADLLSVITGRTIRAVSLEPDPDEKGEDGPVGEMVAGASPVFIASVGRVFYLIHNHSQPYVEDPVEASKALADVDVRNAVRNHKAWISVDIQDPKKTSQQAYQISSRLLSHLVGPDCLALYHPPLNRFMAYRAEDTIEKMKSADPITALFASVN